MNRNFPGKLDSNYSTIRNTQNMRAQFQPQRLNALRRAHQAEAAQYAAEK